MIGVEQRQIVEHDLTIYAKRNDEFREILGKFYKIDFRQFFQLDRLEKLFKEIFDVMKNLSNFVFIAFRLFFRSNFHLESN